MIVSVMCDLYEKTIQLLNTTDVPMSEVARRSNVGYRWLCDLKTGRFSDPGVNKIQRIHDFLSDVDACSGTMKDAA